MWRKWSFPKAWFWEKIKSRLYRMTCIFSYLNFETWFWKQMPILFVHAIITLQWNLQIISKLFYKPTPDLPQTVWPACLCHSLILSNSLWDFVRNQLWGKLCRDRSFLWTIRIGVTDIIFPFFFQLLWTRIWKTYYCAPEPRLSHHGRTDKKKFYQSCHMYNNYDFIISLRCFPYASA